MTNFKLCPFCNDPDGIVLLETENESFPPYCKNCNETFTERELTLFRIVTKNEQEIQTLKKQLGESNGQL